MSMGLSVFGIAAGIALVEWAFDVATDASRKNVYRWDQRFMLFSDGHGGGVFQNVADIFVYESHRQVQSAAYYATANGWVKEYDVRFKTNAFGLVQGDEIDPSKDSILLLGNSFTEGQGAAPWFDTVRTQIYARTGLQPVNGGILGTGFAQWAKLQDFLAANGVKIKRLVVLFISDDYGRNPWQFPRRVLDCIADWRRCDGSEGFYGLPPASELVDYLNRLYQRREGGPVNRMKGRLRSWLPATYGAYRYVRDEVFNARAASSRVISSWIRTYGDELIFIHLPQKHEVEGGISQLGLSARQQIATHGGRLFDGFERCELTLGDFHVNDGHPNAAGYAKIAGCVKSALLPGSPPGADREVTGSAP